MKAKKKKLFVKIQSAAKDNRSEPKEIKIATKYIHSTAEYILIAFQTFGVQKNTNRAQR